MQNSAIWTGITSLYVSQTWPVVLCMYNRVLSIRNTSLYWSQTSPVVFSSKRAWLAPELLVSMVPRPHLGMLTAKQRLLVHYTSLYGHQTSPVVCAFKTATLGPKLHVSMGPRPHLWISAFKTACLASELLVSIGPSPHLCFLHAKQRLLDPNNKSLWVPEITCRCVHAIHRD